MATVVSSGRSHSNMMKEYTKIVKEIQQNWLGDFKCAYCNQGFHHRDHLIGHLSESHDISIYPENSHGNSTIKNEFPTQNKSCIASQLQKNTNQTISTGH
eukprot:751230_1